MKICVPVKENEGKDSKVHDHFGSAPFFAIAGTSAENVEVIANSNEHHAHGMCNPLGQIAGKGVEAVICGGMGAGAVAKLKAAGIKVFKTSESTVADAMRAYNDGKLEEVSVIGACGGHGGCGGH